MSSSVSNDAAVVTLQQSAATNPYMRTFQIQQNQTDPTPYVLYPSSDKTVWVGAIRLGTPYGSQIINFTVGAPPRVVLNLTNTFVNSIVADKQGRVWFPYNDTLAFYDPLTKTVQNAIAFPGGLPQYIAIDSLGRVWLTLYSSNRIGMYDPSSKQNASYPVPTPGAGVYGITVAPDGMIWFTEVGLKKLGRLDPSTCTSSICKIDEYSPPPSIQLIAPVQVAVDGRGVVWFTDHGTNEFGSFNPQTGEWRKLPLGYCLGSCSLGLPNGISSDAQGKIWLSEHLAGRVARYDPQLDTLTEYIVPVPSGSSSTTYPYTWWAWPGPNNLIWFTAFGLGIIGYVNASTQVPLSITANREVSVRQGASGRLVATVSYQGQRTVSIDLSSSTRNLFGPTLLSGSASPATIQPRSGPTTTTITIMAGWSLPLGTQYVALTASDGQIATSLFVKVKVVESTLIYAMIGLGSATLAGAVMFYFWRARRKRSSRALPSTDIPQHSNS